MQVTVHNGITFYEGRPSSALRVIRPVKVEIGGVFRQAQLKTLRDVKDVLAAEAKKSGGNAIVDFEYGQRSVSFWRSLLQLDEINWYGRGKIAQITMTP